MVTTTFCRICEAHCGLLVTTEGDRVTQVRPDREHPVSRGYVCGKGTGAGSVHHDPARLDHPLERIDGSYRRISWSEALQKIGTRVRALRKTHGDRSIAMYTGNPTFFNAGATLWSSAFLEALGSPNLFASHSVDLNNKFHVATAMYGRSLVQPVPDLARCRYFVCIGSNPFVSQMSVVHQPHALQTLKAIEARGGRVVVIDPRRTETAERVGEHLAIRPGTDAVLLLGMLHTLVDDGLAPEVVRQVNAVAEGLETLCDAARAWPADRAASITGIDAQRIRSLARDLRDADGGALYMSTGVNQGPFGSIAAWLVQALHVVTQQLDRAGGSLVPKGAFPALQLASWLGLGGFDAHRTREGQHHRVAGAFPVGALADEIRSPAPDRIRALFVCAGNPVRSAAGRLDEALEELDLLVGIDLYPNDTTAKADFLLPATDMLERSDFALAHTLLQPEPHAQFTEAVVSPKAERREEWRIFKDLAVACGAPVWSPTLCGIGARLPLHPDRLIAGLLRWGGHTTHRALLKEPRGVALPATEPGSFLGRRVPRGKVNLAPDDVVADLDRLEATIEEWTTDGLRLIGRRHRKRHNSWLPRESRSALGALWVHPDDAARLGLAEGEEVVVRGASHAIKIVVAITDAMRQGVVSLPYGGPKGLDLNRLMPPMMEPVSGQAVFNGHPVTIERA
ncbi:MAG: molybdopterin-dependent oxidoreductase [Myxococcota bacterium]